MGKQKFALDIYIRKTFKTIMLFIPLIALSAGICFTILKLIGYYPNVSWAALIIFDSTNVIYCILGAYISLKCEDKDKNLKPQFVRIGKIIILFVIAIQWNYISYMIPSRDFWAFFTLFIFVSIFFLQSKYVLYTIIIVVVSIIISWIINGDNLLPIRNEYFVPEIILRCILIVFVCALMYLITLIVEKLLVKELENIAEYDSLTLLRNRRTLNMKIEEAISDFDKTNKPFCFLMCDIDDFKEVNDTYGHPFGDIVLKNIAKAFIVTIGDKNNIFRYGGEEICCLIYSDLATATNLADDIRKKIENTVHESGDIKVKVTMSMGIMEYKKGLSKEDIIKITDSNLYYAKSHGKNKVIS